MAQGEWADWGESVAQANVKRGVSAGYPKPSGGGSFCYAFSSKVSEAGQAVAKYVDLSNFNPIASGKGCSVRGTLRRHSSAGHSVFLIALGQSVADIYSDEAYLLGVWDAEPGKIALRKGIIAEGIPEDDDQILASSNLLYEGGQYLHLRLDVIVNGNGDVVLNVLQNDLSAHNVDAPVWENIEGMGDPLNDDPTFVDDVLGINSGSVPFIGGGYVGYGYTSSQIGRNAFVDHLEMLRQTA